MTQIDLLPLCGLVGDTGSDIEADTPVYDLMGVMRFAAVNNKGVTSINSAAITADPECLDAMDHIAVTNPELASFPQACEALRAWVLRGGRLLIAADLTGPDVVEALLGDSLPMTIVGDNSQCTDAGDQSRVSSIAVSSALSCSRLSRACPIPSSRPGAMRKDLDR